MKVEIDQHLINAGECFMYLGWVENTMRNFLVLEQGGRDMRERYNESFGKEKLPLDFAQKRIEISVKTFGNIKIQFLDKWPEFKNDKKVRDSIERVVIYRNGIAHSNIQPLREFLLYLPSNSTWNSMRVYVKCQDCRDYLMNCKCKDKDYSKPTTFVFRCSDEVFKGSLYGDIESIDTQCFHSIARKLGVHYTGIAWPKRNGYKITKYTP